MVDVAAVEKLMLPGSVRIHVDGLIVSLPGPPPIDMEVVLVGLTVDRLETATVGVDPPVHDTEPRISLIFAA